MADDQELNVDVGDEGALAEKPSSVAVADHPALTRDDLVEHIEALAAHLDDRNGAFYRGVQQQLQRNEEIIRSLLPHTAAMKVKIDSVFDGTATEEQQRSVAAALERAQADAARQAAEQAKRDEEQAALPAKVQAERVAQVRRDWAKTWESDFKSIAEDHDVDFALAYGEYIRLPNGAARGVEFDRDGDPRWQDFRKGFRGVVEAMAQKQKQAEKPRTQVETMSPSGGNLGSDTDVWHAYGRGEVAWSPRVAQAGRALGALS